MKWKDINREKPTGKEGFIFGWHHSKPFNIWQLLWNNDAFIYYNPEHIEHPPIAIDYWIEFSPPEEYKE